jgi:hypothetical protein
MCVFIRYPTNNLGIKNKAPQNRIISLGIINESEFTQGESEIVTATAKETMMLRI